MGGRCIGLMLIFLGAGACANSCKNNWIVEIEGWMYTNSTIKANEVLYSPEHYMTREVDGASKTFGCLCDVKKCIRKCCLKDESLEGSACVRRLENDPDFKIKVTDVVTSQVPLVSDSSHFQLIYGFGSNASDSERPKTHLLEDPYILTVDGKLQTNGSIVKTYGFDDFCVDYFNHTSEYKVLIRSESRSANENNIQNEVKGEEDNVTVQLKPDGKTKDKVQKKPDGQERENVMEKDLSNKKKDKAPVHNDHSIKKGDNAPLKNVQSVKNESKVADKSEAYGRSDSGRVLSVLNHILLGILLHVFCKIWW